MSIHLLQRNTFAKGYIPKPKDLAVGQLGLTIHSGETALWTKDDHNIIVKLSGGGEPIGDDGGIDWDKIATKEWVEIWVEDQGFATEEWVLEELKKAIPPEVDLDGYATEDWVKAEIEKESQKRRSGDAALTKALEEEEKARIAGDKALEEADKALGIRIDLLSDQIPDAPEPLDGYATEEWVKDQGYTTEQWVKDQHYLKAGDESEVELDGYATEEWVQDQGYVTEEFLADQGYATQEWVQEQIDALESSGVVCQEAAPTLPGDFSEGDQWFCTDPEGLQLYVAVGLGDPAELQWIVASPPVTLEDSVSANSARLDEMEAAVNRVDSKTSDQSSQIYSIAQNLAQVMDRMGKVTLGEAVNNGNIANKPIAVETEDGVSVLEDQCLRIQHKDNPYIRLVDEEDGDAIEIAMDSADHGHIDLSNAKDELHFKFAGQEKVVFRGEGDAEFKGRVKVEPGKQGNEVATYGQLVTIEEEIEQIKKSKDRGQWIYSPSSSASEKQYVLIEDFLDEDAQEDECQETLTNCLLAAGDDESQKQNCNRDFVKCKDAIDGSKWKTTNDWFKAKTIAFSSTSEDGTTHEFTDVQPGMLIDVFNGNDDGFMVASIDEKTDGLEGTGFNITVREARGTANGLATVKFFETDKPSEIANYVRKDGDEMSGKLNIAPTSGNYSLVVKASPETSGATDIFRVRSYDNKQIFYVDVANGVGVNDSWKPKSDNHLVPKGWLEKYVSDEIGRRLFDERPKGPASLCWEYKKPSKDKIGPGTGYFYLCSSGYYRFSFKTSNGVNLGASYPSDKNWNASQGSKFELSFWQRTSGGEWILIKHVESSSTRWGYKAPEGGSYHFEFKDTWQSHDKKFVTGNIYYVTAGGFF